MTEDKNNICCSWYESCTYYMQCEHLYNENKDLSEDVYRLEQENKDLKKQIESDKGLITIGGKQQYEYLQRINELEQEIKELRKANEISIEKVTVTAEAKRLQELEQENKELKEYSQRMENQRENYYKECKKYRSALDTIQKMVLSAWKQGKYLDGGLYNDLINEFTKINEVLNG